MGRIWYAQGVIVTRSTNSKVNLVKKLLSLIMLFGMSTALAGDMPEQVDIYREASFSSKEAVFVPIAFLGGLGAIEWGLHIKRQVGNWTENALIFTALGGILAASMPLYLGARIRDYRLRNVPILSLKSDGLWYHQKHVCTWQDVDGMTHVLDQHSLRFLHIYDRSGTVLVKILLEELACVYDDLINALNSFIDAGHPEHSRLR